MEWQSLNSWLSEAQQQKLTFGKGRAWMPEVERPEFRKDAKQAERSYGKCGGARRGDSAEWRSRWDAVGAVKALCFTTGHHFDEYRKLNIKNPLFTLMADFLCWRSL